MTIKETIASVLSHFAPLTLIKQVFPVNKATHAFLPTTQEHKPWMNADEVELTAEDFA